VTVVTGDRVRGDSDSSDSGHKVATVVAVMTVVTVG
jgi:hypothetical protein